jgi:DNA invertase Pin-like site-specific DNA recombinase
VTKIRGMDYDALAAIPPGVPRGEGHPNSILTEELVREIRKLHAAGEYGYRRIARAVGVSPAQVERVVKRIAWAHVK